MATVETPEVEFRAEARYVRTAPRKAQAVAAEIRGLPVGQARTLLRFMTRAAARDVAKVLDSAVANAESHPTNSYDSESLYVSAAVVGSGPTLKRWQARARGRVGRIRKRTCHIAVRVAPIPGATAVRPALPEQPRRGRKPRAEAAVPAEAATAVSEAPAVEEPVAVEGPETPAEEVAETAVAKPRRARKAAVEPPAAAEQAPAELPAAAEESPAEKPKRARAPKAAPDQEAPKPRRTRAAKAETLPAEAGAAPAAEPAPEAEAPKPRRAGKKAEATSPEGEE
jgi:large subunit ribosomal protein L22